MQREDQQQDPNAGDWWAQNAPPAAAVPSGPVLDDNDPRLHDPQHVSDPEVLDYINRQLAQSQVAAGNAGTPNTASWQKYIDAAVAANPGQTTVRQQDTGGGAPSLTGNTGAVPFGVPTSGFGAAPPVYASNPNAPQYNALPTYVPPTWTGGDYVNPTEADLLASPGYGARLAADQQARERSAAAQGTILNGGTQKALGQAAQNFASNEYQTLRNNTYDAYVQKYKQFTDAAGMDLAARTANANENQNAFQNNTNIYNTGNARTLSDYLVNATGKRNSELDFWQRLQDLNSTGSSLAAGSR